MKSKNNVLNHKKTRGSPKTNLYRHFIHIYSDFNGCIELRTFMLRFNQSGEIYFASYQLFKFLGLTRNDEVTYFLDSFFILQHQKTMEPEKKLYRESSNKMLGGVCAGFSIYFSFDISIVRLLFVLLAFAGGFGILLYFLCWVIIPTRPFDY